MRRTKTILFNRTETAVPATKKKHPYRVGDVFAIPLQNGTFAYGRIMEEEKQIGTLVEIFRTAGIVAERPPAHAMTDRLFHPVYTWGGGFESGRWPIVSSDESYTCADCQRLQFYMGDASIGYKIRQGRSTRRVTPQEVESLEKLVVWREAHLEERIQEALEREQILPNAG